MKEYKEIIIIILILIGVWIGGYMIGRGHRPEPAELVQVDTLIVTDTITIEKPIAVSSRVVDTMYVAVHDTMRVSDTLYMPVPYEVKTYKEEDYYAEVVGYQPSLYYIEVYPKTKIITDTKVVRENVTHRHALALGIEVGYSCRAYIPIYLQYEYMLHKNVRVYGKLYYDTPVMSYGVAAGLKLQVGW